MLKKAGNDFEGKSVVISGSGNVAQYAAEKVMQLGVKLFHYQIPLEQYMISMDSHKIN